MDQELLNKLTNHFAGRFVRKDLTNRIKQGANVPTYVLEYLLGMFANSVDEQIVDQGVQRVRATLANNYVRPDESEKVKAKIRELGVYTVIDKVTVHLNTHKDRYEATFSNLGIKEVIVNSRYPQEYDRLLAGGIWCIVRLSYHFDESSQDCPFILEKLDPIQISNLDINEIYDNRKYFTTAEWIGLLLRTIGLEQTQFTLRQQILLLLRLVPFIENNYNLVELGPRGTGKSHGYKELSPNSILVSGGQTTVANLFYNMGRRQVGLVGMWDLVAFDEVAGINFKDKDGVQIMKDYMASGSFARGKDEITARASMVFVGNINQNVETLLMTSHLFAPFPEAMANDSAFFDRIHAYLPGWEIPKYKSTFFTTDYGFITDYFAEVMRELRKQSYGDAFDKYFTLGNQFNQRDNIAVRKTVSGLIKLIFPDGHFQKDDVESILKLSIEMRRRVKEQLKRMNKEEFSEVELSYIDQQTGSEQVVGVPEQIVL
ncbi:protease Lon-related BREX system protein BrxL [Lactobacillus bombi]|nr:protease Lon-related BREX system protein BrxL [Bombilactobacillus bombi]